MIFKSRYCFANILATKAKIFMKFKNYIHKIVKNHQISFCKDPCTLGGGPKNQKVGFLISTVVIPIPFVPLIPKT